MNSRGPYRVGRGFIVGGQFTEKRGGSDQNGKDLTAETMEPHFRAYVHRSDTALVVDVILPKIKARNPDGTEVSETAGASGWVSGYIPAIAAVYARLVCEIVLVDTTVNDPNTRSTKKEEVAAEWSTAVLDAPIGAAP